MHTMLFLALLALPQTPSAESAHPLRVPTVVFSAAAAADWVSTYRLQQRGGHEQNRMYSWADGRPEVIVTIGAASDVLGVWAWNRYVGRRHPRIARIGLYGASTFRIWLALHNSQLAPADLHGPPISPEQFSLTISPRARRNH
jgi:hypothetical protein